MKVFLRIMGILGVSFLISLLWIIIVNNSYSVALKKAGFTYGNTQIIYSGIDNNKKEYRVVVYSDTEDYLGVAMVTRNDLGIWKVTREENLISTAKAFYWGSVNSFRGYSSEDSLTFDWENHLIFVNNDVNSVVHLDESRLPPNVTVEVWQIGKSSCLLHLVNYSEDPSLVNDLQKIPIWELIGE